MGNNYGRHVNLVELQVASEQEAELQSIKNSSAFSLWLLSLCHDLDTTFANK